MADCGQLHGPFPATRFLRTDQHGEMVDRFNAHGDAAKSLADSMPRPGCPHPIQPGPLSAGCPHCPPRQSGGSR
jgi:hypothetical protein